jgi:hypothetical protein
MQRSLGGTTSATGAPEANRFLRCDCIAPQCRGKPQRSGIRNTRAPGPRVQWWSHYPHWPNCNGRLARLAAA